jgi:hypothetical protein
MRALLGLILSLCLAAAQAIGGWAQAQSYTCPMHPEIRKDAPGKCPKCLMELMPASPPIPDDYDLTLECEPRLVRPNEKFKLRFRIFNPKTGHQVTRFSVLHEELFHLFIVSQDMEHFQHIHPSRQADGSFVIETLLPRPGLYRLYMDFWPDGGNPQVLHRSLLVAGFKGDLLSQRAHLVPDQSFTKTIDGMRIELKIEPEQLIAGRPATLKYTLSDARTAEPVRDLRPYLAAWGHTLILSEDLSDYVHTHPNEVVPEAEDPKQLRGGPIVTFDTFFPRPGNYRIWSQFLRDQTLVTVSFTVSVDRLR